MSWPYAYTPFIWPILALAVFAEALLEAIRQASPHLASEQYPS